MWTIAQRREVVHARGISDYRLTITQVKTHAGHWPIVFVELIVSVSVYEHATDDDLAGSKPKPKATAKLQAAASTDAEASKDNAESKSAPPDSTDTQAAAEQVEEPSGPQTPAQTAARKDVNEAQDQVNFLSHNMATVQSRIDGETDEARKAALKDMLSNYTQQMGDAKRQLERTQQDLQRANQQAARQ